jgi:hypothetical protein
MQDLIYNQQQEYVNKVNSSKPQNRQYSFGVQTWFGINKLSDRYQSDLLNMLPSITTVKKSPGAVATGFHRTEKILDGKECMIGGYCDIRRSGSYLWKIVWDNKTKNCDFFYCTGASNDGGLNETWIKGNPSYKNVEYKFKGINYDSAIMMDRLYICSGEEDFGYDVKGKDGKVTADKTGLLEFDFVSRQWAGVPTGKSAKVYLADPNKEIIEIRKNPELYQNNLLDFNPGIVTESNGQLLITGAKNNPYQFKVSEMYNPRNFVANTLGSPVNGVTVEDNNKAYTFFVPQEVRSLTAFGDKLLIGCKEKFYTYSRTNVGTPVDLDRVDADITGNSGVANYKAVKVFKGANMMFVSDFQIVPELAVKGGQYSSGANRTYFQVSAATPVSQNVEEIFVESDVSNSTIGFYKNYVFTAISKCRNQREYLVNGNVQKQTKNDTVLVYLRDGEYVMWSRLDYIKANYFFEAGNRGLYYCSSEDGNIYRLDESINYIDNKSTYRPTDQEAYNENPQQFKSIVQTQITGVDLARDNYFSEKRLESLWIKGGFSADTIINIKVYGNSQDCLTCKSEPIFDSSYSILYTPEIGCVEECEGQNCVPLQNLNYYKGMKSFKKKVLFNKETVYTELFIEITIENSYDFYISDLLGVYTVQKNEANGSILNQKTDEADYQDYPVQNYDGSEQNYTCQICQI